MADRYCSWCRLYRACTAFSASHRLTCRGRAHGKRLRPGRSALPVQSANTTSTRSDCRVRATARPALIARNGKTSARMRRTAWLNTASASLRRRARLMSGASESAAAGVQLERLSASSMAQVLAHRRVGTAHDCSNICIWRCCSRLLRLLTDDAGMVGVQPPVDALRQLLQERLGLRHQLRHLHLRTGECGAGLGTWRRGCLWLAQQGQ